MTEEEFQYIPYDESLDQDLEEKYKAKPDDKFDNVIVVENIPKVTPAKKDRLLAVLKKIFDQLHVVENGFYLPEGPNPANPSEQMTKGFMFVEFENPAAAAAAITSVNGYELDPKHKFKCFNFADIDKYMSVPDEWVAPEKPKVETKEHLKSWMLDTMARDQFAVKIADTVSIYWNSKNEAPEVAYQRAKWSDSDIHWSPLGTYFVTTHRQGVALWGGSSFNKINRFAHTGVSLVDFSPNEKYMITYSKEPYFREFNKEEKFYNIVIWELSTGNMLRYFEGNPTPAEWPVFKWSHNDDFFGRINANNSGIAVYQASNMTLVDKKAIPADQVKFFNWAPDKNIIAYWTPEIKDTPARVTLLEIPSKNFVRTKNLYNVQDCAFHWQSAGDYLAVKVERRAKKVSHTLEIFRCRIKDIPVEDYDLEDDFVGECQWEPNGDRLCVIHSTSGEGPVNISLFSAKSEKKIEKIATLEKKNCNHLFWSPRGQFLVLGGMGGSFNGSLEFWNIEREENIPSQTTGKKNNKEKEKEKEKKEFYQLLSSTNLYGMTGVKWDPSGRFVAGYSARTLGREENGFVIYDFKGDQVHKSSNGKFTTFLWRPRPRTLLTQEKIKEIKKNIKKYSAEFEEIDLLRENKDLAAQKEKKKQQLQDWKEFAKKAELRFKELKAKRDEVRGFTSDDEEEIQITETKEEILEEIKTPYIRE